MPGIAGNRGFPHDAAGVRAKPPDNQSNDAEKDCSTAGPGLSDSLVQFASSFRRAVHGF
jgi:hypothetical protein